MLFYNWYITWRMLQLKCNVIGEILLYRSRAEKPQVSYIQSAQNVAIHKALRKNVEVFTPSMWAPGPYSQSFFGLISKRGCVKYALREEVMMLDGVSIFLDWKEKSDLAKDAPILVICHGVAGDSSCSFPVKVSDAAYKQGWRAVVYNRRGHMKAPIAHGKGYPIHADSEDMHVVAMHVRHRYPDAPMILVGTSGGGNVVSKYIGDYAGTHPFKGAFASASAHNVEEFIRELRHNPIGNACLTMCLLDLFKDRRECMAQLIRDHKLGQVVDINSAYDHINVWELEEQIVLPFYPGKYKDVYDYYFQNSSHVSFENVDIPLLLLNAKDDILIDPKLVRYALDASRNNSNIISVVTEQGGHCGWLTGFTMDSWEVNLLMAFASHIFLKD